MDAALHLLRGSDSVANLTIVPTVEVSLNRNWTRERPVPSSALFNITQDLLRALKDAACREQFHMMQKVLSIFEGELLSPSLRLPEEQVAAVMAAVTQLEHEAARNTPDTDVFIGRAQVIVDLLRWSSL
jgi:hypothetical protein